MGVRKTGVKKKANRSKKKKAVKKEEKSRGQINIDWIEEYCIIPEGKDVGKAVILRQWQKEILYAIYDNKVPTRQAIISFGRKNAKTALCAFLLLLHLAGPEARRNSQLYSTAQSKEQAAIVFNLAAKIVRMSPDLYDYIGIRDHVKQLYCSDLGTLYRALSADATTAYGFSPVFVVHDELGQVRVPRSELYEAIETACGAQEAPLTVIISTQAPTDSDLLSVLIDDAQAGHDPSTVLFLYTADEDIDPFSEEAMRQANPALGDFLNEKEVKKTSEKAKRMPSLEAGYRNLVLNQRVAQTASFVARTLWKRCGGNPDPEVLKYYPVYAALDLSARNDLSALLYGSKDEDEVWHIFCKFFAPMLGVKERSDRDRAPYDVWANKGLLTLTPGASIEYSYIADEIIQLYNSYNLVDIAFDRWRIDVLLKEFSDRDIELPLTPFGQGYKDMAPALDESESVIVNELLRHGNHPILNWCTSNAVVVTDPAGNRKLDKSKSSGRIDGLVSMVMLIGNAAEHIIEGPSVYEGRGLRTL